MAQTTVNRSDTFEVWRQKTNVISIDIGDLDLLDPTLGTSDLVSAINTTNVNLNESVIRLESRSLALAIALG